MRVHVISEFGALAVRAVNTYTDVCQQQPGHQSAGTAGPI